MAILGLYNKEAQNRAMPPSGIMARIRPALLTSVLAVGSLGLAGCSTVTNVVRPLLPAKSKPETVEPAAPTQVAYDAGSKMLMPPDHLNRFLEQAGGRCAPVTGPGPDENANEKVSDLYRLLSQSAIGRDQWHQAATYKSGPAWICFNEKMVGHGAYYTGEGVLVLNDKLSLGAQVATASHELAHLMQEGDGLTPYALRKELDKEEMLHFYFAREATAEALSVQALWEIKEKGFDGPWVVHNSCDGGPGICYKSISDSFAKIANADPANVMNGSALRAAVYAWYDHPVTVSTYRSMFFQNSGMRPFKAAKIPDDGTSPSFDRLGEVSIYQINYVREAGGLRNILLQGSAQKAASPLFRP